MNSDIVGKLVNIASRCAGFIARGSAAGSPIGSRTRRCRTSSSRAGERIAALYEARDLAGAVREIMALTDRANLYIDQQKPWLLAKDPARAADVQAVCTQGLNLFRVLALYLKPVMPRLAAGGRAVPRRCRRSRWARCGARRCSARRSTRTSRSRRASTRPRSRRCSRRRPRPEADRRARPRPPRQRPAPGRSDAAADAGAAASTISIDDFAQGRPADRAHRRRPNSSTAPTSC